MADDKRVQNRPREESPLSPRVPGRKSRSRRCLSDPRWTVTRKEPCTWHQTASEILEKLPFSANATALALRNEIPLEEERDLHEAQNQLRYSDGDMVALLEQSLQTHAGG